MSSTNGHIPTTKEQLTETRRRVALKEAQHKLRLYEAAEARHKRRRLMESGEEFSAFAFPGIYSDMVDMGRMDDRNMVYPFSTAMDRRYGANWPFWRTWQEHARLRAASRLLYFMEPLASGAIGALTSYVIGKGMHAKIVGKRPDVPPEIIREAQAFIDDFVDGAEFLTLQQEYFMRGRRDGEAFLREFGQDDGMTLLRIVEPECVVEPPGDYEVWSFGIGTDPDDLLDIREIFVAYNGSASDGEAVPFSELLFVKENVEGGIKRGLPDFAFNTQLMYKTVGRLLTNMGEGAAIQAAIAFVRQHSAAPQAAVEDFVGAIGDYTETVPFTGQQRQVNRWGPGTQLDMDKGQEFVAGPAAENVASYSQVVQALLRAVAVKWNAPEWITSADSSNGNYASSLTAESPFVKFCERLQGKYSRLFKRITLDALMHFCRRRGGLRVGKQKYSWQILKRLLDVSVVAPSVETRDKSAEAQRNKILKDEGIKSPQTWQQEEGLDPEEQERNFAEWEKKHPQQQGGPPGGGDNPMAAMMGGGGPQQGPGGQPPEQPQQDEQQGQQQPDQQEDTGDIEAFLNSLEPKKLAEMLQRDPTGKAVYDAYIQHVALLEGVGSDKRGRILCWDDRTGHRIKCHAGVKHHETIKHSDGTTRTYGHDLEDARQALKAVVDSPHSFSPDDLHAVSSKLKQLTAEHINQLKKELGIRAGGTKDALVHKINKAAQQSLNLQQQYERQARAKGVPAAYVTQIAREDHKRATAFVKDARKLVMMARQYYRTLKDGKTLSLAMPAFKDGDPAGIPELEIIARGLQGEFPVILRGEDSTENARILYDLLLTGGPSMPSREDAFKQALDRAESEEKSRMDAVPFDVPGEGEPWEKEFEHEPEFLKPPEPEPTKKPTPAPSPSFTLTPAVTTDDSDPMSLRVAEREALHANTEVLNLEYNLAHPDKYWEKNPHLTDAEIAEKFERYRSNLEGWRETSSRSNDHYKGLLRGLEANPGPHEEAILSTLEDAGRAGMTMGAIGEKIGLPGHLADRLLRKLVADGEAFKYPIGGHLEAIYSFEDKPPTKKDIAAHEARQGEQIRADAEDRHQELVRRGERDREVAALAAKRQVERNESTPDTQPGENEPGFTGTDSLDRQWIDGKLVAKQEEPAKPTSASSPDVTQPAVGAGKEPEKSPAFPIDNKASMSNTSVGGEDTTGVKTVDTTTSAPVSVGSKVKYTGSGPSNGREGTVVAITDKEVTIEFGSGKRKAYLKAGRNVVASMSNTSASGETPPAGVKPMDAFDVSPIGTVVTQSAGMFGGRNNYIKTAEGWRKVSGLEPMRGQYHGEPGEVTDPAILRSASQTGQVIAGVEPGGRIEHPVQLLALPNGANLTNDAYPGRVWVKQADGIHEGGKVFKVEDLGQMMRSGGGLKWVA